MPLLEFVVRLSAALAMGMCVGLERQWRQRMAGTRTNALVAAGAAAFVMCGFMVPDAARGAAQIVPYEAHMRALLLQAMASSALTQTALRSEDIEGTPKMKVTAQIKGLGRQDTALEQLVVRLSLEAGVSSVSWSVHPQVLE